MSRRRAAKPRAVEGQLQLQLYVVCVAGPAVDWQAALGTFPLTVQSPERERVGRRFPHPTSGTSSWSASSDPADCISPLPTRCMGLRCICGRLLGSLASGMRVVLPSRSEHECTEPTDPPWAVQC